MPEFAYSGISFHYEDTGAARGAIPFVFQHGLGADTTQPFGLVRPPEGFRMLAFDVRGHGETRPMVAEETLHFGQFTRDLEALLAHLGIDKLVVGGVSLGAAVALHFALKHPRRTLGLVLSRPAWLDGPNPFNVRAFTEVARLIRKLGLQGAREAFVRSELYAEVASEAPDTAESLARQMDQPKALETVARLERIPQDAPLTDLRKLAGVRAPVLILANRKDPVHPSEYAERLAAEIRGAQLLELTPKSVDPARHCAETQQFVCAFLEAHREQWKDELC